MSKTKISNSLKKKIEEVRNGFKDNKHKRIFLYVVMFALVFSVCCLYALFQMTNSKSITITMNSASVSSGQNPDGSAFDIYQILSDEVLEAAAEKLNGKISASELKKHLSVSDALSATSNQQLKQSILNGEHENTYFPTVYCVTYETIPENIRSKGAGRQILAFLKGLAAPDKSRILAAVAESYQEFYEASYLSYGPMFEIPWEKIDGMDYYNRAVALRTEAMRILRFLQDKEQENLLADTSSAMLSYGDLANDLWQLISVDIENHQAYIIQNNITTSRKELQRQFRYMEEIYKEEAERKTEEYLILGEAVDMYDSTTTKIVFIPALDQDNSFYMNRTKIGLDYLVESADAARLAADEAEHNAQYYQYLQACFVDGTDMDESRIYHADAVYINIKNQIEELVKSVKELLEERNKTENEGIKVSNAVMTVGIVGVGMSFAKRFAILCMAAYVVICAYSAISGKKCTDAQEV